MICYKYPKIVKYDIIFGNRLIIYINLEEKYGRKRKYTRVS